MKKHIIIFFLILIVGIFFRLINLDKASGLWYDESTIYSIASQQGLLGMYNADSHRFLLFPLYYIIYNLWINIFGNSDLIIRLMSVFFDALGIITAYYAGAQFGKLTNSPHHEKAGLTYMLLYAINSSFIYYAQEAKFYSLTFFIINLILLFWLKFIYNKSNGEDCRKNLLILTGLNFVLISVYTSQILLVILLFIATIIYLLQKKLFNYKEAMVYSLSFTIPFLASLFFKNYVSGNFDAVVYDNSFILLALQNWFTPMLNGLQNNVLNYHLYFITNLININFWIFVAFPIIFIVCLIIKSIKSDKTQISLYLFSIAIAYVILHIIFTYTTSYNVLVRYTLPILPLLLLTAARLQLKNKIFLYVFIIVNIVGIISISGAPHIKRPDGYKALADTLTKANVSKNYDYVMPIRADLLDKYFYITGKKYSIYNLGNDEAQTFYLTPDEINGIKTDKTNKNKYIKRFLSNDTISKDYTNYILKNFTNNKDIVVIKDKSIAMFSDEQLKIITQSQNYNQYPFQFLRISKFYNNLTEALTQKYKLKQLIENKNWEIYIFELQ